MPHFQFTYTRCTMHGNIIEHIVETIFAYTVKSAKLMLVKRFGLQNWQSWRQTANGSFVKTNSAQNDYRGKIIIEPTGDT